MFYKRISDLVTLGKPTVEGDWNNLKPIPIKNASAIKYSVIESDPQSISDIKYLNSTLVKKAIPASAQLASIIEALRTAFNKKYWYQTNTSTDITYTTAYLKKSRINEDEELAKFNSEYYPKAIWFEVLLAKNENNKPTVFSNSAKVQSKKINAYNFICNALEMAKEDSEFDNNELNITTNTSLDFIKTTDVYVKNLQTTIISANLLDIGTLLTEFVSTKDLFLPKAKNIRAISAAAGNSIKTIKGTNFYYPNQNLNTNNPQNITNLEVISTATISENAYIKDISVQRINQDINNLNYTYLGVELSSYISFSGIASYFICDTNAQPGQLVKFGGTKDVTLAGTDDPEVHGIILENGTPGGIILNSELSHSSGYLKLVLLCGTSPISKIWGPTGVHYITATYDPDHTPHIPDGADANHVHHDLSPNKDWKIHGCCQCKDDVGIGAPLYLSRRKPGGFDISANTSCSWALPGESEPRQIAIVAEPTDNGSLYNYDAGYTEISMDRIDQSICNAGGRQTRVYFNTNL